MPNIPTVPGSEIDYDTPQKAVQLNAGALSVRSRGMDALAGAIGQIGDRAEGLERDLQHARNARIAADVDLKMRTARQTFLESLRNDSDEASWVDRARETAEQVQTDIFSTHEGIAPEMRSEVNSQVKSWTGSLMLETKSLSDVQTVNRAWGTLKQDYTEKLKDADAPGAMATITLARKTKLADPAELDDYERAIPKTIASNMIENGFQANPAGTTDLLQSGGSLPAVDQNGNRIVPSKVFSPKELEGLIRAGVSRTAAWQKTNYDEMLKSYTDPATGLVPDHVIDEGIKTKQIEAKTGFNLKAANERTLKVRTEAEARELKHDDDQQVAMLSARTHDPTAWGVNADVYANDLIGDASKIADPARRLKAIDEVNKELTAVKKTGQTSQSPSVREAIGYMRKDFEDRTAAVPVYGNYIEGGVKKIEAMTDQTFKATFGEDANREAVIAHAQATIDMHRSTYDGEVHKLIEWSKLPENKDATPEQVEAERVRIQAPAVEQRFNASVNGKKLSRPEDLAAWDWAMANPKDPRAQKIFERLNQ